jgi:FixJ family two-component response regulator
VKVARTIYLVDDDDAVSHALTIFLQASGYRVRTFSCAEDFLEQAEVTMEGIMLLDQRMTGMTGLDLQSELHRRNIALPIIFISGHADVPMSVRAIKHGAVNFLEKPFSNDDLLRSVGEAFACADEGRELHDKLAGLEQRFAGLTEREVEVMQHVVSGMSNRRLAEMLGVCERTVEVHRSRVMKKMGAETLPDLVRMHTLYQEHLC